MKLKFSKNFLFLILISISLCFFQTSCRSSTEPVRINGIFVSKSGNDRNIGLYDEPFFTINRALEVAQPGDTIWVTEGVYQEILYFQRGGLPGKPIVLKNFRKSSVVIDGTEIVLPEWDGLINIYEFSYIGIDGITVKNSSEYGIHILSRKDNQSVTLKNCTVENSSKANFAIEGFTDVILENCVAAEARNGYPGFYFFRNKNVNIRNCQAYRNGGVAGGLAQGFIFYEGEDYHVVNCQSFENQRDGFDAGGGEVGVKNIVFDNCTSFNNGEDGFGLNSYSIGARYQRCLVYNNGGSGFNLYQGIKNVEVVNCTIVGGSHYFWIDGSDDALVPVENISIWNCIGIKAKNRAIITKAPFRQISFDYNCWLGDYKGYGEFCLWNIGPDEIPLSFRDIGPGGDWTGQVGQGTHSFSRDPRFVDPENHKYILQSTSPCIDSGKILELPYFGSAPDIGAFEFSN